MNQSTLWLAELQFFLSLSFVAVFFAIELGLSWVLFAFRLRTLGGNQAMWLPAYRTWVRVFALATVLSIAAKIGRASCRERVMRPVIGAVIVGRIRATSCDSHYRRDIR